MDNDSSSLSDSEQKVLAAFVKKMRDAQKTHHLPRLSLQDYSQAFSPEDRPTDEQIENFIKYVADAHSWYKHLPLVPPGRPFFFFLDPCAGYDVYGEGVATRRKERNEESRIHYNFRLTSVWRSDFGALQYVHGANESDCEPAINIVGCGRFRIPLEVVSIGVAELTAVVHE